MAARRLLPAVAGARRKDPFARWFRTGVFLATIVHTAVFVANPGLTIAVP